MTKKNLMSWNTEQHELSQNTISQETVGNNFDQTFIQVNNIKHSALETTKFKYEETKKLHNSLEFETQNNITLLFWNELEEIYLQILEDEWSIHQAKQVIENLPITDLIKVKNLYNSEINSIDLFTYKNILWDSEKIQYLKEEYNFHNFDDMQNLILEADKILKFPFDELKIFLVDFQKNHHELSKEDILYSISNSDIKK